MTAAHTHFAYEDIHQMVDRLTESQAEEVRSHLRLLVHDDVESPPVEESDLGSTYLKEPIRRELPFLGMISAEPDLAERSEEILRDEIFGGQR